MTNKLPFVQVACICEKILHEKDEVVSLIRIVDRFTLSSQPAPGFVVPLEAFVALKPGALFGHFKLGTQMQRPDGTRSELKEFPLEFRGGAGGANLRLQFQMLDVKEGQYWLELLWGSELLSSIPIQIIFPK